MNNSILTNNIVKNKLKRKKNVDLEPQCLERQIKLQKTVQDNIPILNENIDKNETNSSISNEFNLNNEKISKNNIEYT